MRSWPAIFAGILHGIGYDCIASWTWHCRSRIGQCSILLRRSGIRCRGLGRPFAAQEFLILFPFAFWNRWRWLFASRPALGAFWWGLQPRLSNQDCLAPAGQFSRSFSWFTYLSFEVCVHKSSLASKAAPLAAILEFLCKLWVSWAPLIIWLLQILVQNCLFSAVSRWNCPIFWIY